MARIKAVRSTVIVLGEWLPQGEIREFDDKALDCDDVRHAVSIGLIEFVKEKAPEPLHRTTPGGGDGDKGTKFSKREKEAPKPEPSEETKSE